jgi:hypothetical protein
MANDDDGVSDEEMMREVDTLRMELSRRVPAMRAVAHRCAERRCRRVRVCLRRRADCPGARPPDDDGGAAIAQLREGLLRRLAEAGLQP